MFNSNRRGGGSNRRWNNTRGGRDGMNGSGSGRDRDQAGFITEGIRGIHEGGGGSNRNNHGGRNNARMSNNVPFGGGGHQNRNSLQNWNHNHHQNNKQYNGRDSGVNNNFSKFRDGHQAKDYYYDTGNFQQDEYVEQNVASGLAAKINADPVADAKQIEEEIKEQDTEATPPAPPAPENPEMSSKKDEKKAEKQEKKAPSSSSSSTSTSESEEESDKKKSKKKKLNAVDFVTKVQKIIKTEPKVKIKKEPVDKKLAVPPSSSSSSESSSESQSASEKVSKETLKKTPKSAEKDVVCLGKVETFQNLVDDEDSSEGKAGLDICLLCDKKGHTSFNCQMICKNCGAPYHCLKDCPKPANLSIMLQNFLEFCMAQCCQYNPEQRFQYKNGLIQGEMLPGTGVPLIPSDQYPVANSNSPVYVQKTPKRKRAKSSNNSNAELRTNRRKVEESSDSESSRSSNGTSSTKRRKKRSTKAPNTFPPHMPFAAPFAQAPIPFGGFNPSAVAYNPMMAFSQMMGFNPAMNFAGKK